MAAVAKKGWDQYMLQLQLHPLRTKAITAGVLSGISDSVAQKLSGFQRIQHRRLLLKVIFGFAYGGPFGHFLHKLLDKLFKGKKDNKTVAKKMQLALGHEALAASSLLIRRSNSSRNKPKSTSLFTRDMKSLAFGITTSVALARVQVWLSAFFPVRPASVFFQQRSSRFPSLCRAQRYCWNR